MTLHRLRIFVAVARHLNLHKVASEFHISQPAVSQELKLLEEEYGVKLHKRVGRGIDLTEKGRGFLRNVEVILLEVETLDKQFKNQRTDTPQSLTLGADYWASTSWLPLPLALFRNIHPELQLTVRNDDSLTIEESLVNSEVQVGCMSNPCFLGQLVYEACREDTVVVVAPRNHLLTKRRRLTLRELAELPLIVKRGNGRDSFGEQLLRDLNKPGLRPNVAMRCESIEAVKAAVKAGIGLGILFHANVELELGRGFRIMDIPELGRRVVSGYMAYPRKPAPSSEVEQLLALLRSPHQLPGATGAG